MTRDETTITRFGSGDAPDGLNLRRLVRGPGLALRPRRLLGGGLLAGWVAGSLAIAGLLPYGSAGLKDAGETLATAGRGLPADVFALRVDLLVGRLELALVDAPVRLFVSAPVAGIGLVVLVVIGLALIGGFVARSAALELGGGRDVSTGTTWAESLGRVRHALAALLAPQAVVFAWALLAGGIAAALDGPRTAVGGVATAVLVVASIPAAVLALAAGLGLVMAVPAAVCEDGDSFDVAHRPPAYAIAAPLTLAGQLVAATVMGLLGAAAVWAVTRVAVGLVEVGVSAWSADLATAVVDGATRPLRLLVPGVAVLIFVSSYVPTAGVVVYLFMRERCDGRARDRVARLSRAWAG